MLLYELRGLLTYLLSPPDPPSRPSAQGPGNCLAPTLTPHAGLLVGKGTLVKGFPDPHKYVE